MTVQKTAFFVLVLLLACGLATAKNRILPEKYEIKNIHAGVAEGYDSQTVRDICGDFRFTEREVREYFRKADVISEHVRQHGFDTLPCYVRGDMVVNGKAAHWEIQASSTGTIRFDDGRLFFFGCGADCRGMFDAK